MAEFKADFTGAIRKTEQLKNVPRATRHIFGQWVGDTVLMLKRRAAGMQKSGKGRHTAQLSRNIGQTISAGTEKYQAVIGTGVGGTQSVKYARIQDEGGTTHPRVTPAMRRWAWAMHLQNFASEIKGMGLRPYERRGAKETYRLQGSMYMGIALTKKSTLNVKVPATHWFTNITSQREKDLEFVMSEEHVLRVADGMSKGGTP